ncbi:ABC transporter ATP-binding protein [Ekhidna sp.]|uniref:ABC transporter ATP-binding protein n=1 Tax=Ekhidna sp. TaxID=2608089 RepID=UPI003C7DBBB9
MLEAINLSKKYGEHEALTDLNLTVSPGEVFCLLGANGAGKTTTINLFMGFIPASAGQVKINGIDVSEQPSETKKYLAYIPENLMLYPNLTGLENLDYFCGLGGKNNSREQLEELLSGSGLQKEFIHKRVSSYSKGMRQKVGIALAKAREAKALLLDEPTSGLDPQASNEFSALLQDMKDRGVATLMATHDLFRAKDVGTHIGIMREGKLEHVLNAEAISLKELEELYLETMKLTQPVLS